MHVADDELAAPLERLEAFRPGREEALDHGAVAHRRRPDVDDRRARLSRSRASRIPAGRSPRRGCRPPRRPAEDSASCEWQIVTVACRWSNSSAIGLPTMSLRPITTARVPGDADLRSLQQLDDAGRRAGHERRAVLHEPADVDRMEPVHVLVGADRVEHLAFGVRRPSPRAAATARGCRRGPRCGSGDRRRPADRPATRSAGSRWRSARRPASRPISACCRRRPPTPGRCPPARCPARAAVPSSP